MVLSSVMNIVNLRKFVLGFGSFVMMGASVFFIVACSSPPLQKTSLSLQLDDAAPYLMDVAAIEVINRYRSPFNDPYVEHLSPVTPADAIRSWASARFRAVGQEGTLLVTITDGSIEGKSLDTNKDFKALFISEQGANFVGTLSVTLEVLDAQNASLGSVVAYSSASRTLAEDASLTDRDYAMFHLTQALLDAFDFEASRQVDKHFHLFLR
tara:strand:+ start:84 stop:716 length:633 start_codon:yes stop_codon:yes gene_type:complete